MAKLPKQQKRGNVKMNREKGKEDRRLSAKKFKMGGIIAALAASFAIFAAMVQIEKNILTQYERGTIYIAAREIPRGQLITEDNYKLYFMEQQLDKSCIPDAALRSPEQVAELATVYTIEQGVLLTQGMFRRMDEILAQMERPVVAGFKAEDIYQVAGGVLRAGDRVNIYAVREDGASLVWQWVYVQQVFDASGNTIPSGDTVTAAQRVNVFLDEADVEDFYTQLAGGSLRVVKLIE